MNWLDLIKDIIKFREDEDFIKYLAGCADIYCGEDTQKRHKILDILDIGL